MAADTDTPKIPEMVERVANAMHERGIVLTDPPITLGGITMQFDLAPHVWLELAERAIRAMREPTEAMLRECADAYGDPIGSGEAFWRDMINAALETP